MTNTGRTHFNSDTAPLAARKNNSPWRRQASCDTKKASISNAKYLQKERRMLDVHNRVTTDTSTKVKPT